MADLHAHPITVAHRLHVLPHRLASQAVADPGLALQIHLLMRDETTLSVPPFADDRIATATRAHYKTSPASRRRSHLRITDQRRCVSLGTTASSNNTQEQRGKAWRHAASCTGVCGSTTRKPACISVQFQRESEPLRSSISAEQLSTQSPSLQ